MKYLLKVGVVCICVYSPLFLEKIKSITDGTMQYFYHQIFPFGQISEHLFCENLFENEFDFFFKVSASSKKTQTGTEA